MSEESGLLTPQSKDIKDYFTILQKNIAALNAEIGNHPQNEGGEPNFNAHLTAIRSLQRYLSKNLSVQIFLKMDGEDYPRRFSEHQLLINATADFLMIKRSFDEARIAHAEGHTTVTELRKLIRAIALGAFSPAVKPFFDEIFSSNNPMAVTYQTHRFEIRVVPYSSVIFIGYPGPLPLDEVAFEGDENYTLDAHFVALAHEIGHKVYNHGYITLEGGISLPFEGYLRAKILSTLARAEQKYDNDQIEWAMSKLEELFSDAYGSLIDGPASVLGFQKQMELGRPAAGLELNHRYLYSPLRPLVQSRILRALVNARQSSGLDDSWATQAADSLDERWREWVKANWTKWLASQWPDLTTAGQISQLPEIDLIEGARYPFGDGYKFGHALLALLDYMVAEIVAVFVKEYTKEGMSFPLWTGVPATELNKDTVEELLLKSYTQAAKQPLANGFGNRPETAVTRRPPRGTETKLVLGKILGKIDYRPLFNGDEAAAQQFAGAILGAGVDVSSTVTALMGNDQDSDEFKNLVHGLVEKHNQANLDNDVFNQVLGLLTADTVSPEHIDEIVERQLLRGWSDEGPRGGSTGGFT